MTDLVGFLRGVSVQLGYVVDLGRHKGLLWLQQHPYASGRVLSFQLHNVNIHQTRSWPGFYYNIDTP